MKFVEDIDKDIEKYTEILTLNNAVEAQKCVKQIEFVYGKRVDGLNGLYRNAVWDGDVDWIDLLRNAIRIVGFYKEEYGIKVAHDQKLGINRLSETNNEMASDFDISDEIQKVKSLLEGSVSDLEFSEITEKLDELQRISMLDVSPAKKWLEIKGIANWSVTKGVGSFMKIMPIIYKILTVE